MSVYLAQSQAFTATADAIRTKGGTSNTITWDENKGFADAVNSITPPEVSESDITFYDYEGTIVESWTLAELANKTALPAYPSHAGLICQGWNWSLADLKSTNRKMNVGAMYITDDGKTRIYIHLEEGRTSPMLGVCPNGTVTVDWGDGTTPDTLTGTSTNTVKWTPNHNYAAPGDYVIKLTVSGTMDFYGGFDEPDGSIILRYSENRDNRNKVYQRGIRRVEIGTGVTIIGNYAFMDCHLLSAITIPSGVTAIQKQVFQRCWSLPFITIPSGVKSTGIYMMASCYTLSAIAIPSGITSFRAYYAFLACYTLSSVTIPDVIMVTPQSLFSDCYSLSAITIPASITDLGYSTFADCYSLSAITIPASITEIKPEMFYDCYGIAFYDFNNHTAVPTLANTNAFTGIAADCEIRVPAALVDEWKVATNWATYADHIVGV